MKSLPDQELKQVDKLTRFSADGRKILAVLPSWNEEGSIGNVILDIKKTCPEIDALVVDDGSGDDTAKIAQKMGAQVLQHDGNKGYTAAIQSGRQYSLDKDYDITIFLDSDGQHRPKDIVRILDPLLKGEADIVRGSREVGHYDGKEPFYLYLPRLICAILVSLKLKRIITDPTSGFKGEIKSATKYFKDIYEKSCKIHLTNTNDIEECLLARKGRFRIMEVPVIMLNREIGNTKCYSFKQLLQFPWDLIRTLARNLW